jgi:hypothetical protein
MFAQHCTACDTTYLIFPSQVRTFGDLGDTYVATYECWCGAEQVWLSSRDSQVAAEAAA